MEPGFSKADSDNLPDVDSGIIDNFYISHMQFVSSEIRHVKTQKSARASYGDEAVGYVQVKRDKNICTVRGRITPEHKINKTPYHVEIVMDETAGEEKVLTCVCKDCAAAAGGCKHGVAFLFWLHRRSSEAAVTSTECYWKKSTLSKIANAKMDLQSLVDKTVPPLRERIDTNVSELVAMLPMNTGGIFDMENYHRDEMSVYQLYLKYKNMNIENERSAESFINFMKTAMDSKTLEKMEIRTRDQSKNKLWYELKFARITASRLYESAKCKTLEGSLKESIMGAAPAFQTEATARGIRLESEVLQVIAEQRKIKIGKAGLFLKGDYPLFGASPDGISEEYCIEVKCPSKETTVERYIAGGVIQRKFYFQIQLQMLMSGKKKGIFGVASPKFEDNREVTILDVAYNEQDCKEIISAATEFWKKAIFSALETM